MIQSIVLLQLLSLLSTVSVHAFFVAPTALLLGRRETLSSALQAQASSNNIALSRAEFWRGVAGTAAVLPSLATSIFNVSPAAAEDGEVVLPSGVSYKVLTAGDGPIPNIGELVGIRFRATCGDNKFDDIFDSPEPYYTRVGAGRLLKGVEEIIPKMRVGDEFLVTIPPSMAFGEKGRPSSAGKPRIPGNAVILFDIKMVGLPGREQELIDIIGDV
eukprot:CAMPEP_0172415626 /NCGR_PEP_ID=MMETSP1064-20121228/2042_1 /TAXON_ID=202472 /ORGANISM="Aulacoseira subarctica , Strain CCAP 1002/5" /LENGTH=215 /DNA_ID=CAMNT_0013152725 /DNA_START=18 /DNA_END=665 /DNA_ORIENTATION=-